MPAVCRSRGEQGGQSSGLKLRVGGEDEEERDGGERRVMELFTAEQLS